MSDRSLSLVDEYRSALGPKIDVLREFIDEYATHTGGVEAAIPFARDSLRDAPDYVLDAMMEVMLFGFMCYEETCNLEKQNGQDDEHPVEVG